MRAFALVCAPIAICAFAIYVFPLAPPTPRAGRGTALAGAAIADLRTRYGATDLLVKRDAIRRELGPDGLRWRRGQLPYGRYVRQLVRGGEPAALHLPAACRRWGRRPVEVYDIACIGAGVSLITGAG